LCSVVIQLYAGECTLSVDWEHFLRGWMTCVIAYCVVYS